MDYEKIFNADKSICADIRVGQVVYLLNQQYGTIPVINETVGTTFTTLPLTEAQVINDSFLRKVLKQNGFELVTEERELDFLVISRN